MADENDVMKQVASARTDPYWEDIHKTAVAWTDIFVAELYRPARNMRYVFLPATKQGDVEMLRVQYTLGDEVITITQTACIFSLAVTKLQHGAPQTNSMEALRMLARRVFLGGQNLNLKTVRQNGIRTEGDVEPEMIQQEYAWLKGLKWWQENDGVVFYFIKDDGKPSAMDKGYDLDLNTKWFTGSGTKMKETHAR